MELSWMGRYRQIVAALVCHSNYVSRTISVRKDRGNGIMLSSQEYQVLEVLVEHEDETLIMTDISNLIGILPSSFSKITKQLLDYDLVERYRIEGNRKNIILKPSQKGRKVYLECCERNKKIFSSFFAQLESLNDEQVSAVADALTTLNMEVARDQAALLKEQHLIKI